MTAPYYQDEAVTLYHGNCLDILPTMADASVDAVITDPPYDLTAGKKGGTGAASINLNSPYGRSRIGTGNGAGGFMGKAWDSTGVAFDPDTWRHVYRVMKPGAYLLAFGGTRTWHRLACAVEDAGFEIRDSMAWLYGSGFPKSLDVSKAIDRARNDEPHIRNVCRWLRKQIEAHPTETVRTVADRFGFNPRMVEHWAARDSDSQPTVPTLEQWDALRAVLGFGDEQDAEVYRLNIRKGEPGEAWKDRPVVGVARGVDTSRSRLGFAGSTYGGDSSATRYDLTVPATKAAKQWQGYGTALKPAFEPVVLARKPLRGTVAANVQEYGTGALNIDGCRIAAEGRPLIQSASEASTGIFGDGLNGSRNAGTTDVGRWPANVVLDAAAAAELDRQSGTRNGSHTQRHLSPSKPGMFGSGDGADTQPIHPGFDDAGGASRFFYTAKAPQHERPSVDGVSHPTVKPLDLMRWLVRLVTPPGGVVLDPFAGTGTTAEAAIHEHKRCITIEREAEYLPLIVARLSKPMEIGFDFGAGV